ncbi:MAG: GTP-binding protein, partial [Lachnospiraceae bacterium]|nr:GTP-binding protein [Lachnospiraceae bacterium]
HHHHDGEECDDPECECHHHHHHDDDDDEEEHEHHHHHHHGHDDDEHECCHHHHDDDDEEHECCHHHGHEHHHHHHHPGEHDADEVFTSWGRESARKYTEEELAGILKALADENGEYGQIILRAKGIIPMADGSWRQFDLVPEETEVRTCEADYTGRLCVIGCELKEEKLAELFGLK